MLHGYCIRLAGDPPPSGNLTGIESEPVRLLETDRLGLWTSAIAKPETRSIEVLKQHERVVREALRTATPLPLRFGTLFRDDAEALTTLLDRGEELENALRKVADRVEMGVRVSSRHPVASPDPAAAVKETPPTTGRAYLEWRRKAIRAEDEKRSATEALLAQLVAELTDFDGPAVSTPLSGEDLIGSVAHLVHKGSIESYRMRIARLQREHPDLDLVVSGPWAPYSFV